MHLRDEKIAQCASLLGRNPDTIRRNYKNLLRVGFVDDQVVSRPFTLGLRTETTLKYKPKFKAVT